MSAITMVTHINMMSSTVFKAIRTVSAITMGTHANMMSSTVIKVIRDCVCNAHDG